VSYGRWLARPAGEVPELPRIEPARAQRVLTELPDDGRWLAADEVAEMLGAYGIAMPETRFATNMRDAGEAAEAIGYPVAVKLMSREITHKSDVSGVVLGLTKRGAVEDAFAGLRARLAEQGLESKMDGVMVQAMAPRGVETFVGVTYDAQFGPLVGFGMGGVAVEVWKDVVFRVPPLTDLDAREMLDAIRGTCLLDGFRGAPPADRQALSDALLRVSRLVADVPEIHELDINPLVALAPGHGVLAVDARVRVVKAVPAPSRRGH
jgi:acyl-CoA synthetase (NDP forming)